MANTSMQLVDSCIEAARNSGNYNFEQIARNIFTYKKEGKKLPSYSRAGRKHIDAAVADKVAQNPNWAGLQQALKALVDQEQADKAAARAQQVAQVASQVAQAVPQVVPQIPAQVAPQVAVVPQVASQVVAHQGVTPAAVNAALAQGQAGQQELRPVKYGTVLKTFGSLRLVQGQDRNGNVTYWVADPFGKSAGSLGKLEQLKQTVAILEAVKGQLR